MWLEFFNESSRGWILREDFKNFSIEPCRERGLVCLSHCFSGLRIYQCQGIERLEDATRTLQWVVERGLVCCLSVLSSVMSCVFLSLPLWSKNLSILRAYKDWRMRQQLFNEFGRKRSCVLSFIIVSCLSRFQLLLVHWELKTEGICWWFCRLLIAVEVCGRSAVC